MSPLTDKPRRGLRPKAQTLTAAARHRPDVGGSTLGRAGSRQKMPIARPGSPACQRVRRWSPAGVGRPLTPGRRVSGCSPPPSRCAPRGVESREPAPLLPARTLRFPWKPQNAARRAGRSDGNLSMRRGGRVVPMETSERGAEGGLFRWKPDFGASKGLPVWMPFPSNWFRDRTDAAAHESLSRLRKCGRGAVGGLSW